MSWYGKNPNKTTNLVRLSKKRLNRKIKLWNIPKTSVNRLAYKQYHVYIPPMWDYVLMRHGSDGLMTVYMYSDVYYVSVALPAENSYIIPDSRTSTVSLTTLYSHNFMRLYFAEVQQLISMFYRPLFKKIKFKGKGYYIYKNKRNTITPQFGYSHRLYVYSYFISVKFLSKTSIFIFGFVKSDLARVSGSVKAMRPINIFTGRGVRFAKQVIYKKAGKVSSYR